MDAVRAALRHNADAANSFHASRKQQSYSQQKTAPRFPKGRFPSQCILWLDQCADCALGHDGYQMRAEIAAAVQVADHAVTGQAQP